MELLTLNYEEYGDKNAPLILFLHGGGVSSWMWDKQVQYFTNYHCVNVDLPGHGLNNQEEKFSIDESSYKIIDIIEKLANGKCVTVVGFSLGSQVLIRMLSIKPNLIDYAMINSALVRPTRGVEMLINPLLTLSFPLIKNKTFSKLQAKTLYIGEEHFEKYYEESCQMERQMLVSILKENMSFEIPEEFSETNAKILVTVGSKEKAIMKKSALDLVNHNQNCTYIIISEVGHGAPLAQPDLFNQIMEKWMNDESLKQHFQH